MSACDGSRDRLILPPLALAGCLFGALLRDTRGRGLTGAALYNHFPASPLVTVTWVFHGRLHLVEAGRAEPAAMAPITVRGAQPRPLTSWSPGEVLALTQAFKPEAWAALVGGEPGDVVGTGAALNTAVPAGAFRNALAAVKSPADHARFAAALEPLWSAQRPDATSGTAVASLADWVRSVTMRAALSGTGKSVRHAQRRLRAMTGHNRRRLDLYAQVEDLYRLSRSGDAPLARLALDGGFADQSHMGRAVRKVTGFSPSALSHAIAEDEAFWAYRLLGEWL